MKKLMFFLSLILCFLPMCKSNIAYAENISDTYIVTANSATIFQEANFNSTKLKTIKHKCKVKLEMKNENPKEYINDSFKFYKVINYDRIDGFIFSDLLVPETKIINAIPIFNASTNKKATVYFSENNSITPSQINLNPKTRIFLYEGFNKKLEFTPITFVNENEVLYGFLKTEDVNPDGINPAIIYSIIVTLAILGIIFTWLFMKGKKLKK